MQVCYVNREGPNEDHVRKVMLDILNMAKRENLDSSVFVMAMADCMGVVAATLEAHEIDPQSLDLRMELFYDRVKAKRMEVLNAMAASGKFQ